MKGSGEAPASMSAAEPETGQPTRYWFIAKGPTGMPATTTAGLSTKVFMGSPKRGFDQWATRPTSTETAVTAAEYRSTQAVMRAIALARSSEVLVALAALSEAS